MIPVTAKLILASQSPRRRELLTTYGYDFDVHVPSPHAEDAATPGESPSALVCRLAFQKAQDVALRVERGIVIGCDTVAECDGEILGKPIDLDDARRMLRKLRGQEHRVLSGLCVWPRPGDANWIECATTTLVMDSISDDEIEAYLRTGEWEGKAGAFGYQDRLGWIHIANGSESNVVGLPMELLAEMLSHCAKRD